MFPAGIRAAPFPAYAWLPPARLLLEPVNGSRTLYVDSSQKKPKILKKFASDGLPPPGICSSPLAQNLVWRGRRSPAAAATGSTTDCVSLLASLVWLAWQAR